MKVTESIINTALLGTVTKELTLDTLPSALEHIFAKIQTEENDTNTTFCKMMALTFAYHRAGLEPFSDKNITTVEEAPEEELPYFSHEVGELLKTLYINHNWNLLLYAYRKACEFNKLLLSSYLPDLINHAFMRNNPNRYEERKYLSKLAGKRGHWLLSFMGNKDWDDHQNESWETAKHPSRVEILRELRAKNPQEGLKLLESEFKSEPANHRLEFIECLRIGLNKNDESFLKEVSEKDRSSNVKQLANQLLFDIPDSEVSQKIASLLKDKIHYNRLLGWSYDSIEYTEELKKMGVEEVSPHKKEKDHHFILRQLAERVPLDFWVNFFGCSLEESAKKLARKPPFSPFFELHIPIENFTDNLWAYYTLQENPSRNNILNLIGFLTPKQRENINLQPQPFGKDFQVPEKWFDTSCGEWGIKFSLWVVEQLVHKKYYYLANEDIERLAICLPKEILSKLEYYHNLTDEKNPTIINLCKSLIDHINIKIEINTLFNNE